MSLNPEHIVGRFKKGIAYGSVKIFAGGTLVHELAEGEVVDPAQTIKKTRIQLHVSIHGPNVAGTLETQRRRFTFAVPPGGSLNGGPFRVEHEL